MSQWSINPVGSTLLVTIISALLLAALVWISPMLRQLGPKRQTMLIVLRVLVFLLIIMAMLRPTLVNTEMRQHPSTLLVLLDESRSMDVKDSVDGTSRWQLLNKTLSDGKRAIANLGEQVEVLYFTFDGELHALDGDRDNLPELPKDASGKQTAIGASLEELIRRQTGKRLLGVLLLSDGAQQAMAPRDMAPQLPARQLADQGTPIFTIPFGRERGSDQAREISLTDLVVNPTVFIKNELQVTATVQLSGMVNQAVQAELLYEVSPGKMQVVGSKTLRPTKDDELLALDFQYIPQTAGEHKLTVRVEPQPGELVSSNNFLSTFVTVLDGGLNVLYLEGDPRVEQKFLRDSLNTSPDIRVDYESHGQRTRKSWPIDISEALKPGKYNVYIIGDLDSSAFRPEDLRALRDAVEHGAGLMMLGGFHSFWAGGYQNNDLRQVLPLESGNLGGLERQNFDEPIRRDLHLPGPLKMLPDQRYGNSSVMRLAPGDANVTAWKALPPLDGANKFRNLKPTAKPLAVTENGEPLLVSAEPGTGRVLAFAGDSTWQWWLAGQQDAHKRFWRQAILWLAKKDESSGGRVWAKLDGRRFPIGGRVDFIAGAKNAEGAPDAKAEFTAEITLPDGNKRTVQLARKDSGAAGIFSDTNLVGDYQIELKASSGGKAIGETHARFTVYDYDMELSNPAARPAMLASLAKITADVGGKSVSPEQFNELLAEIKNRPQEMEVATEVKQTPWDRPEFFLLLVGLLASEWYLRKRWGLV